MVPLKTCKQWYALRMEVFSLQVMEGEEGAAKSMCGGDRRCHRRATAKEWEEPRRKRQAMASVVWRATASVFGLLAWTIERAVAAVVVLDSICVARQ